MRLFWFTFCLSISMAATAEDTSLHHSFRYYTSYGSAMKLEAMAFSPDGKQLAVSISDAVQFIDTRSGEVTAEFDADPFSMQYTPDGRRLYMLSRHHAHLLDVTTGQVLPTSYQPVKGQFGIEFEERNGKLLIKSLIAGSSAAESQQLQVGDELVAFGEGQTGNMDRFTGRQLYRVLEQMQGFAGTYGRVTVLPRGRFGKKFEQTVTLRRLALSQGNAQSAHRSRQGLSGPLVWCVQGGRWHEFRDAATGTPVAHLETIDINNFGMYAISPDQKRFAVVASRREKSGNAVEVFDIQTQQRLACIPLSPSSYFDIAFAADSNRVLVGTWDTIEIADTDRGQVVGQMTLGYQLPKSGERRSGRVSAGHLMMHSVQAGLGLSLENDYRSPRRLLARLAVSSTDVVATGDCAGRIHLWDLNTGAALKEIDPEQEVEIQNLQFSPDGRWIAYYLKGTLHLEDVSDVGSPEAMKARAASTLKAEGEGDAATEKEAASAAAVVAPIVDNAESDAAGVAAAQPGTEASAALGNMN